MNIYITFTTKKAKKKKKKKIYIYIYIYKLFIDHTKYSNIWN